MLCLQASRSQALRSPAVNINTATKDELNKIPGVGPVRAQVIVDYRAKNGLFKSAEDPKKSMASATRTSLDMKDKIATSGPTKVDWDTAKKEAPKADAGKKEELKSRCRWRQRSSKEGRRWQERSPES